MASIISSTELSRQLSIFESNSERGDYDLDGTWRSSINFFKDSVLGAVPEEIVTLSSTRIEVRYSIPGGFDYRLALTGSGIGPVSTLEGLTMAIGDGLATGRLDTITLSDQVNTLLTLALAPGGYTLTSGIDVIRLTGSMPTTFAQMAELGGLLGQLDVTTMDMMTPAERADFFNALSAYGVTGFSAATGATNLVSIAINATGATLSVDGLSVTLTGTLPNNFGALASVLYDIFDKFGRTDAPTDLSQLPGLGVSGLVITNNAGAELLRLSGEFTTEDSITLHTITGTAGDDFTDLREVPLSFSRALTANLLAGNDVAEFNLSSFYEGDYFGNVPVADQQQVSVDGGAGVDTLILTNYIFNSSVNLDLATGVLEGFRPNGASSQLAFRASVSGFETVTLVGHGHNIFGGAGNETVRLSDGFILGPDNIIFNGGAGIDTLDLSGTAQSGSGFPRFFGVTRDQLTSNYQIDVTETGAISFMRTSLNVPTFELTGVESLMLRTSSGGTETVSVASLLPTNYALSGEPVFTGSYLSERITGTTNAEEIRGMGGVDVLIGDAGNDTLRGGDGTDTLNGGTGDDFIYGGLTSADLRDVAFGGDGNDSIDGGWGNDELSGGNGNDTVLGDFGSDTVVGNDGNDLIGGGAGSDLMFGNAGNDTLNGGFGFDRMNGGTGADSFFHAGVAGHASDWIQDYNAAEGDVLTVGLAGATRAQFQINTTTTTNAGAAGVAESFIIYRPTGQILWALVDGDAQSSINVNIGGQVFDLMA